MDSIKSCVPTYNFLERLFFSFDRRVFESDFITNVTRATSVATIEFCMMYELKK